jgi:hypothetical protein
VPVLTAIEMFTGKQVTAEIVQTFINDPSNAINLQSDAHHAMDSRLAWGIEAKFINNEVRVIRPCSVADLDIT